MSTTTVIRKASPADKVPTKREGRIRRFTIVDEKTVDRDGDIMICSGGDWRGYESNPVVLLFHDFFKPPVGKCTGHGLTADGTETWADVFFAPNEIGDDLLKLYDGGFMRGASIGFRPIETSRPSWQQSKNRTGQDRECLRVINRWEVLEVSLVTIPSQPNALMKAMAVPGFIQSQSLSTTIQEAIVAKSGSNRIVGNDALTGNQVIHAAIDKVMATMASRDFADGLVKTAVAEFKAKAVVDAHAHAPGGMYSRSMEGQMRRLAKR